ncbi:hypothetical protein VTI74DRAFT_114 [Chaetomium olivicolor]
MPHHRKRSGALPRSTTVSDDSPAGLTDSPTHPRTQTRQYFTMAKTHRNPEREEAKTRQTPSSKARPSSSPSPHPTLESLSPARCYETPTFSHISNDPFHRSLSSRSLAVSLGDLLWRPDYQSLLLSHPPLRNTLTKGHLIPTRPNSLSHALSASAQWCRPCVTTQPKFVSPRLQQMARALTTRPPRSPRAVPLWKKRRNCLPVVICPRPAAASSATWPCSPRPMSRHRPWSPRLPDGPFPLSSLRIVGSFVRRRRL